MSCIKKIFIYITAISLTFCIAVIGVFIYSNYEDNLPTNKIVDVWRGDFEISQVEFMKDGNAKLVLSGHNITGNYTMNTKKSELVLNYLYADIYYTRHFKYSFEQTNLILDDLDGLIRFTYSSV